MPALQPSSLSPWSSESWFQVGLLSVALSWTDEDIFGVVGHRPSYGFAKCMNHNMETSCDNNTPLSCYIPLLCPGIVNPVNFHHTPTQVSSRIIVSLGTNYSRVRWIVIRSLCVTPVQRGISRNCP